VNGEAGRQAGPGGLQDGPRCVDHGPWARGSHRKILSRRGEVKFVFPRIILEIMYISGQPI
jgi:hypothetical protein